MTLLIKPNEQNQTCLNSAMAGKSCAKANLLVKPNEQNQACLNYAMARKSCALATLLVKPDEQNQTCLNSAMARKDCAKANYYHILFASILLLFGCDRIYPNKLTPKEVEIDASEQTLEFRTTRKIFEIGFDRFGSQPNINVENTKCVNGIFLHDEGWFSMRLNTNDPDSCNIIKFKINKNESGKKRTIIFGVVGDICYQTPHGTIIQNAQ